MQNLNRRQQFTAVVFGEREGKKKKDGCVFYLLQSRMSMKVLLSTTNSLLFCISKDSVQETFRLNSALVFSVPVSTC